jgi:class 3 adenylate cyclase
MSSFSSTAEAVNCAVAIQQGFERYNRGNAEPIHVRIGLDCGEPVEDSNDLFGSTVQLAARLCSAASPGQILVSENIYREHGGAAGFEPTKRRRLKGFSHPVSAFECAWSAPVAE